MSRGGHNFIDLKGQKFGELTVLFFNPGTKSKPGTWTCRCICKKIIQIPGSSLRTGNHKSCGCQKKKKLELGLKEYLKRDQIAGSRKSAMTAKLSSKNQSGVKGVSWVATRKKWRAYIGFKSKQINLGYFESKDEAIRARKKGEEKYHKPLLEVEDNDR